MAINKGSFLKSIGNKILTAGETIQNKADSVSENMKTKRMNKKLVSEMMEKEYPPYTVTGEYTYNKRKKETANMVKNGNMKDARNNLKNLSKQFEKDNPIYPGKGK